MDPQLEAKIESLQKYVPHLAKLIERLEGDALRKDKLAQMRLLYNLLINPDKCLKIDTLLKCEDVLSRVFDNATSSSTQSPEKSPEKPKTSSESEDKKEETLNEQDSEEESNNMEVTKNVESSLKDTNSPANGSAEFEAETEDEKKDDKDLTEEQSEPEMNSKAEEESEIGTDVSAEGEEKCENGQKSNEEEAEIEKEEDTKNTKNTKEPEVEIDESFGTTETEAETEKSCETKEAENEKEMKKTDRNESELENEGEIKESDTKEAEAEEEKIDPLEPEGENEKEMKKSDSNEAQLVKEEQNIEKRDKKEPEVEKENVTIKTSGGEEAKVEPEVERKKENIKKEKETSNEHVLNGLAPIDTPEEQSTQEPEENCTKNAISSDSEQKLEKKIEKDETSENAGSSESKTEEKLIANDELIEKDNEKVAKGEIGGLAPDTGSQSPSSSEQLPTDLNELEDCTDPLSLADIPEKNDETEAAKGEKSETDEKNVKNKAESKAVEEDDDDDVLLIENHCSPICLDSDKEDENDEKPNQDPQPEKKPQEEENSLLVEMSAPPKFLKIKSYKKSIQPKQSDISRLKLHKNSKVKEIELARGPDGKTETIFLIKKDPRTLFETIDLLDSDTEDEKEQKTAGDDDDDDVILVSETIAKKALPKRTLLPVSVKAKSSPAIIRKKPTPLPSPRLLKRPTPQSNFLNAVNLQPTPKPGEPPRVFSAQISHKKVIIPNAFYGSSYGNMSTQAKAPPANTVLSNDESTNDSTSNFTNNSGKSRGNERNMKEWLENFVSNFSSPRQITSHYCYVLLQRVLNYKAFQKIKETRSHLNASAQKAFAMKQSLPDDIDVQLLLDLRSYFIQNDQLTESGQKFCNYATNDGVSRNMILTTDFQSGEVTCRTREPEADDLLEPVAMAVEARAVVTPPKKENKRNSRGNKKSTSDDDEYRPDFQGVPSFPVESSSEKRWSLRANRSRRKDDGFSYNEDQIDKILSRTISDSEEESDDDDKDGYERRPTTAKRGRPPKRKSSFERSNGTTSKEPTMKKKRITQTDLPSVDDDDLLTPAWVETVEVDSDDGDNDEPQFYDEQSQSTDDDTAVTTIAPVANIGADFKNIRKEYNTRSAYLGFCILCSRKQSRVVNHYVNEHPKSEVIISRLAQEDVDYLSTNVNVGFLYCYKASQNQYGAHCVFCNKEVRFLLPYWYDHFTMHTGEYCYECTGCGTKKPTKPLLKNHLEKECKKKGKINRTYVFDTKANQIQASICTICNFTQLHRKNVVKHVKTQHGMKAVNKTHIKSVVLLQISGPYSDQHATGNDVLSYDLSGVAGDSNQYNYGANFGD